MASGHIIPSARDRAALGISATHGQPGPPPRQHQHHRLGDKCLNSHKRAAEQGGIRRQMICRDAVDCSSQNRIGLQRSAPRGARPQFVMEAATRARLMSRIGSGRAPPRVEGKARARGGIPSTPFQFGRYLVKCCPSRKNMPSCGQWDRAQAALWDKRSIFGVISSGGTREYQTTLYRPGSVSSCRWW